MSFAAWERKNLNRSFRAKACRAIRRAAHAARIKTMAALAPIFQPLVDWYTPH